MLTELTTCAVWTLGSLFQPGDRVCVLRNGQITDQIFQCRQKPFGDFCSQYSPENQLNVIAWKILSEDSLPEVSQKLQDCLPYVRLEDYHSGSLVCSGQHVWQCRGDSGQDWCNRYAIGTEFAYLAWELVDAKPNFIKPLKAVRENTLNEVTDQFAEPSLKQMLALLDPIPLLANFDQMQAAYVLPVSLQEYWDNFYEDTATHFYDTMLKEKGDKVQNFSKWHESDKTWQQRKPIGQRDIDIAVDIPKNPIIKDAATSKHLLLLQKTPTAITIGVINSQEHIPLAEDFEIQEYWDILTPDTNSH